MGLGKSNAPGAGMHADLFVEAMDWPEADKIAKRIRMQMDPAMLDPDDVTPQMAANAQGKAAAGQQAAAMAAAAETAKTQKLIADTALFDVSSSFAMEQIKFTTALPLGYAS